MIHHVVFARLLAIHGVAQTLRTCHAVPLPEGLDEVPEQLRAYCGTTVITAASEWSMYPDGMPCMACMIAAPEAINAVLESQRNSNTRTPNGGSSTS